MNTPNKQQGQELKAECPKCDGFGFTAEHANHPHDHGDCQGMCPVQVQCEHCQGTGEVIFTQPTPEGISPEEVLKKMFAKYLENDTPERFDEWKTYDFAKAIFAAMIEYASLQPSATVPADFLEYVEDERDSFCEVVKSQTNWDNDLRTCVDSFLICFDQMKDRLKSAQPSAKEEGKEIERLKRLLHDLTPGGSEFYNDPEYCAKWVKETWFEERKSLMKRINHLKSLNDKK